MTLLDLSRQILAHDIDPEFLQSASVDLAWEYHRLYEELRADRTLPVEVKLERFAERRGSCAVNALVRACQKHGVPYNFRTLDCNGQHKLLVKIGRVVLIQEPMLELSEKPRCVVPECNGALSILSRQEKDALWEVFFTAAPARRRVFEPSSKRRKRAPGPLRSATD